MRREHTLSEKTNLRSTPRPDARRGKGSNRRSGPGRHSPESGRLSISTCPGFRNDAPAATTPLGQAEAVHVLFLKTPKVVGR